MPSPTPTPKMADVTATFTSAEVELFLKALKVVDKQADELEKKLTNLGLAVKPAHELRSRIEVTRMKLLG